MLTLEPGEGASLSGSSPEYPWGGLYGGQIVGQALLAAGTGVDPEFKVHSTRAYFIRRGRQAEPVLYDIDPIRDGRSFCTRRVVAHQGGHPILNLEASFQRSEVSEDIQMVGIDPSVEVPPLASITKDSESWSTSFDRSSVRFADERDGIARAAAWMRSTPLPADSPPRLHAVALAFISDDMPTEAVIRAHPVYDGLDDMWESPLYTASLDHTIWFHRDAPADQWQLHDFRCQNFVGGRGLAMGHIHTASGVHVATVAQEVLLRVPD